jgi:hypothetical protein
MFDDADIFKERDEDMKADYGFGLPLDIPNYQAFTFEDWTLEYMRGATIGSSYIARSVVEPDYYLLTNDGHPWMSTSLMERESHAWHMHMAHGNVVVAGLGMGMYLHAIAAKDDVVSIIVAEQSAEVITLFKKATDFENWPFRDKITIVHADCLSEDFAEHVEQSMDKTIDYLYLDIWDSYPHPDAQAITKQMSDNLQPKYAGWWGQELELVAWLTEQQMDVSSDNIEIFFKKSGINVPVTKGFVSFCEDVFYANSVDEEDTDTADFKI